MIEAFTGLPGQGKTYNMTKRALLEMKKGKKIYANYDLKGATYFKELYELQSVKNAIILVDEAGIYLPAQSWRSIPFEFVRQIRQHRHDGLNLWYTAQDMQDVATYLRRITQFEHEFHRIGKFYYSKTRNPRTKAKYGFDIGFINKKVGNCYDTNQNIEFAEYMKENIK
jgi:Zonular occludens toxin (Zot)